MIEQKKMGRKPLSPEDKMKFRSVSIDVTSLEDLVRVAENLKAEFGFRPTMGQTVRYLIKLSNLLEPKQ